MPDRAKLIKRRTLMLGISAWLLGCWLARFAGCMASADPIGAAPSLTGHWELGVLDSAGQNHRCYITIKQEGGRISGEGDETGQHFLVEGTYKYPEVMWRRIDVDADRKPVASNPIEFRGSVDWVNNNVEKNPIPFRVHMVGEWSRTKHVGSGWRAQVPTNSDRWEAGLIEPLKTPTKPRHD